MNKKLTALTLAIIAIFSTYFFAGCQTQTNTDKLVVYASFYPLYDFAKKVGGDKVEVYSLVSPGQEAHHYEPSAKQIVGLAQADLIVINGLDMEMWMENLSPSIKSKILNTSANTNLIQRSHEEDDEHQGHNHGDNKHDPHIWLSIKNAKKQMENIKNKLMILDTKNASYYQNNYEKYAMLFNFLDQGYKNTLQNVLHKDIVVSHRAFGYIAHDYGLTQHSLSGIETDQDPSPLVMANIQNFIIENQIKAIFYQTLVNSKVAELIANKTGAKLYQLHTLEALTKSEIQAGNDYLSIMAQNLINLQKGLS